MQAPITLAQAIRELRSQLTEAAREGEGAGVRFVPKSVEVELGIVFEVEAEASGVLKLFSHIDLSGRVKTSDENTHKVTLTLEPAPSWTARNIIPAP
jgi:hypothetical protein